MRSLLALLSLLAAVCGHTAYAEAAKHPPAQILTTGLGFPEGTVFLDGTLYFVDYQASAVYRLDGNRHVLVARMPGCGTNGLVPYHGHLLVACYDGGTVQEISLRGAVTATFPPGRSDEGYNRPNDLASDAHGGVYFTASGDGSVPGKVYYIASAGTPAREMASDIRNANGIALSPDGKILYVGESTTDKILRFDIAADGSLSHRGDFAVLDSVLKTQPAPRHTPDGIRSDREGRLFVSLYNGGGLAVLDARGQWLASAALPGDHHSNLALSPDESTVYGTVLTDTFGTEGAGAIYRIPNPVPR
jgi:gluconolactonase